MKCILHCQMYFYVIAESSQSAHYIIVLKQCCHYSCKIVVYLILTLIRADPYSLSDLLCWAFAIFSLLHSVNDDR
jgi:hypothetical protein